MYTVSIDVGGTEIKYALFSKKAEIVEQFKVPTPSNKEKFKGLIVDIVRSFEEKKLLEGLGISLPGYINAQTGFAERGGALTFLDNTNVIDLLRKDLSLPIFIENDANCAALAESRFGHAVGVTDFLLLTVGTGIGGALYLDNKLYTGGQFKAGELGKMRINYNTHPHSTLHEFAAVPPLIRNFKALKLPDTPEKVTGEYIFEQAEQNDKVEQLIIDWIDTFCVGIFNMAVTLNPQKILIGGGVSANPKYLPLVNKRMKAVDEWKDFEVPIVACKFYNAAGVVGAYHLVREGLER